MLSRRILAAVAILCALVASAQAQSTKAQINTEITANFPDNNVGAITPAGLRLVTADIVNSIMPTAPVLSGNLACFNGTTGLLQDCGLAPAGIYIAISGDCTASSFGVITCTKTNSVPFGTMAVQNANSVSISGGAITGMPNPSNASDVANKSYVDSVSSGIIVLASSALATAAVLPNSPTYSNGALGVGATLTAGSNTTLTVDGTAAPLNTVVLVKNQASAFQNGVYTVTTAGSGAAAWVLTRATYFDQAAEMKAGSYTFISGGATNIGSAFSLQTAVTTVGTDALSWLLFNQGSANAVLGGGSSVIGDIPLISNTTNTGISDSGFSPSQIPGLIPSTATVTISNGSPGVISWAGHTLTANAPVYFCTNGTLPTGLTACTPGTGGTMPPNTYQANPTVYYVVGSSIVPGVSFTVATSIANAKAGTAVNTSSAGSGTHTAFANSVACAGCIGEHIYKIIPTSGTGSVACNNAAPDTLVATLTLNQGIWKIWGASGVFGAGGAVFSTNHTSFGVGISGIQSTPYGGTMNWHVTTNQSNGNLWPLTAQIVPIYSGATAVNMYSEPVWAGGTANCFGEFHAERVH